jgi:hypothetical protein
MKTKQKTLMRRNSPCLKCGGQMEIEYGHAGTYWEPPEEPAYYCSECGNEPDDEEVDWEHFEEPCISRKQAKEIEEIRSELEEAKRIAYLPENREETTIESLFFGCPAEGDFHYEGEPEDVGNAWSCGDDDCENGWHESCQYIDQGREDGKTWFVVREDSIAGSGDYQPIAGWDEREGDEITESVLSDLWFHLQGRSVDHFYGWGIYCLECAKSGEDPLNNWRFNQPLTTESAIEAAKDNLKYLKK